MLSGFLWGVLAATSVNGQEIYGIIDGGARAQKIGLIASVRDIDQDGVDDFVVGAINGTIHGLTGGDGDLYFVSGASLETISRVTGKNYTEGITGFAVVGDYDGDGFDDVAWGRGNGVSTPGTSLWFHALVQSSVDRRELARFDDPVPGGSYLWGHVLTGVGDVDQDGFDDVLVGGHDTIFRVYGGPDGHLIREHLNHSFLANSAAEIGDVDLDGVSDYVIGSGSMARVTLFSGATGAVLRIIQGTTPGEALGYSVTGIGDVDGDGIPDIGAGAVCSPSGCSGSAVYVFSGASGAEIFESRGASPNQVHGFGEEVHGGGDINGDGVPDFLASSYGFQDYIDVYSMRTGSLLWRRSHPISPGAIIVFPRIHGDLDGDGLAEWSVSDPHADFAYQNAGRIWIFRGAAVDAEPYCPALPNSLGRPARLFWVGPISTHGHGAGQRLDVVDAAPSSFAQVLYGLPTAGIPFGDGVLCIGGTTHRLDGPFSLDPQGNGTKLVNWTVGSQVSGPGAWLPGLTFGLQVFYRDIHPGGAGFNTTDAWEITFAQG